MTVKQIATILTWVAGALTFLYWLGIIEPLGSRLARETAAVDSALKRTDTRVEQSERAIIDLQYGIKSIENMQVQLSSISARLATIELRIAAQVQGGPK